MYEKFYDIDFDELPNEFILKCTHDSGSYCICTDKKTFNVNDAKRRLLTNFKYDYFYFSREWPYKGLKHRIIAEPLLHDGTSSFLRDYKFYTFNGEPEFFYTTSNRGSKDGVREDFFDLKGNLLNFNQKGYFKNPNTPQLPKRLDQMTTLARMLAKDTYHLRVDFYEVDGKVYVGELTFFDGGGFAGFEPVEYDRILGDMIHLPIQDRQ